MIELLENKGLYRTLTVFFPVLVRKRLLVDSRLAFLGVRAGEMSLWAAVVWA